MNEFEREDQKELRQDLRLLRTLKLRQASIEAKITQLQNDICDKLDGPVFFNDSGEQVRALRVTGTRTKVNADTAYEVLGECLWNRVSKRVADEQAIMRAVDSGLITREQLMKFSEVIHNNPYVRFRVLTAPTG